MGQARKASAVRAKRNRQGRSGGRPNGSAAPGVDQAPGLSASQHLDARANGEGLADGGLASADETNSRYRRLRLSAEAALELLVTAPGVPANVRASAVRTALELVGAIGARSKDQRDQEDAEGVLDPERLTVEDIDREINKLGRV
jgi:hypothetical protein